jgi:hypothetical protein
VTHTGESDFGPASLSWGYYLAGGFAGDDMDGPGGTPTSIMGGGTALPSMWTGSPTGPADFAFGEPGRILEDGSWDAWSFGMYDENFNHQNRPGPEAPEAAAIPEPASASLLVIAMGFLVRRRRG